RAQRIELFGPFGAADAGRFQSLPFQFIRQRHIWQLAGADHDVIRREYPALAVNHIVQATIVDFLVDRARYRGGAATAEPVAENPSRRNAEPFARPRLPALEQRDLPRR